MNAAEPTSVTEDRGEIDVVAFPVGLAGLVVGGWLLVVIGQRSGVLVAASLSPLVVLPPFALQSAIQFIDARDFLGWASRNAAEMTVRDGLSPAGAAGLADSLIAEHAVTAAVRLSPCSSTADGDGQRVTVQSTGVVRLFAGVVALTVTASGTATNDEFERADGGRVVSGEVIVDQRSARDRGDRGDVMLMTVVFVTFLMVAAWALVSAGQQWGARRDAQASAAAAARAAAAIQGDEVRAGGVSIDPSSATNRAQAVLAASGYAGSVAVNGLTVTVTVSGPIVYSFPAPGFDASVTAGATATAARGVQGDEGG